MQQIHGINVSVNIGEALEARTKDPLWFLARQWLSGEFEAENGGRPAFFSIESREHPLRRVTAGGKTLTLDLDEPLEFSVEKEGAAGDAPAWRAAALEYAFQAETDGQRFEVEEYHGRRLDWHHFRHAGSTGAAPPEAGARRITPTQIHFPGAPHPRWWRFEEAAADFDLPHDPEPNTLSMLLPEFFYIDVNNWYIAPLPARAGVLREIVRVQVVDSFGVTSELGPAAGSTDGDWQMFTLSPAAPGGGASAPGLDGRFLLLPNVAQAVLYNDDIEDVRFVRDEEANLVWAIEHRYTRPDGVPVVDGGTQPAPPAAAPGPPRFVLRSETLPHHIPYVPRQIDPGSTTGGETYLRRARSLESATQADPQYKTRIVAEAWRINEEEIPRSGSRVRRTACYARGSNGCGYHWVGRIKEAGRPAIAPGMNFDYIEENP